MFVKKPESSSEHRDGPLKHRDGPLRGRAIPVNITFSDSFRSRGSYSTAKLHRP